jgi:hypothetical protein
MLLPLMFVGVSRPAVDHSRRRTAPSRAQTSGASNVGHGPGPSGGSPAASASSARHARTGRRRSMPAGSLHGKAWAASLPPSGSRPEHSGPSASHAATACRPDTPGPPGAVSQFPALRGARQLDPTPAACPRPRTRGARSSPARMTECRAARNPSSDHLPRVQGRLLGFRPLPRGRAMLDWLTWGPILTFPCDERERRPVHGGSGDALDRSPRARPRSLLTSRGKQPPSGRRPRARRLGHPDKRARDAARGGAASGPSRGGGKRASAVRMLTLAVAIVVVVVLGALWRRPSPPSSPPAVTRATATPSHAKSVARPSDLETALAELDRLRRAEGRAHLALLAIERTAKEAANAAKTAASAEAPGIWSDLRAEAQREYEEAQRQRAEFEFQLRAQYGDLPR